jgi:hypothetical protein
MRTLLVLLVLLLAGAALAVKYIHSIVVSTSRRN